MTKRFASFFCVLVAGCGPGVGFTDEGFDGQQTAERALTQRLRVMAGNLTSGTNQSYDLGHGARIFDALDPDVVLVQEFNAVDLPAFVRNSFGAEFVWARGGPTEQIPNGVISRYPIVTSGTWADSRAHGTRGFTWALIDVPGATDLFAVSVHLSTASGSNRTAQAAALVARVRAEAPPGAWVVIGGDFNTGSRNEGALSTLSQVVVTAGPYPADRNGNTNTSASRSKPYDWVLVGPGLHARAVPTVVGSQRFDNGFVADTRVFQPVDELAPALRSDSGAKSMQHMGVVRDFDLQVDVTEPPPPPPPPPPSGVARVIINEVLANEPGTSSAGEFVELVNVGDGPADLSGWVLSDASNTRHVFAAGSSLPAGVSLVVTGATASTGNLGLANGGDTVTLSAAGQVVDQVTYLAALAGVDGASMNRAIDGDASAPFVLHTTLSSNSASPGTKVDGSAF